MEINKEQIFQTVEEAILYNVGGRYKKIEGGSELERWQFLFYYCRWLSIVSNSVNIKKYLPDGVSLNDIEKLAKNTILDVYLLPNGSMSKKNDWQN